MIKVYVWLFVVLVVCPFGLKADITGTVFKDADADGVADATEVGLPGAIVSAFDDTGSLISQTASCGNFAVSIPADPPTVPVAINVPACPVANFGQYTLTGLTPTEAYRLEVSFTDPLIFSTANGVDSVKFESDGATNVLFGANYPEDYCQNNPRIVAGCYVFVLPGSIPPHDPSSTEPLIVSWPYDTRFTTATNAEVHTGSYTNDADYGDLGHIFGVSVHRPTREVFFSSISAPTWDDGIADSGGIYTADYSGAGDTFVPGSAVLFVDMDDETAGRLTNLTNQFPVTAGALDRFGEQGLGGIEITSDGTTMWAINMGAGTLLRVDIGNPAVAPDAADVTETPIIGANCVGGRFRPSAVTTHRGSVFIGGVCDASTSTVANLKMVVLEYDGSSFTNRLDEALDFNVNQIFPLVSFPMAPWSAVDNAAAPQPVMTDISFDDSEGLIIGLMPRIVYNSFAQTSGVMLRAHPDGLGGFDLENAGVSGPYTTNAETNWTGTVTFAEFNSANPEPLDEGPGGAYFFENGIYSGAFAPPPFVPVNASTFHPVLFSAGITVVPGTGEVAAGFTDPVSINSFGVRYLDRTDGTSNGGLQFGGLKVSLVSDVQAICRSAPLELGNRLWCDSDRDGIQDPGESGANGIEVSFQCGAGNPVTVSTAGDGNYAFTDTLYGAVNGGEQIPRGASCTVSIPTTGANATALNTQCNGSMASPLNNGGVDDNADLRDSDGTLNIAGTVIEILVTTGGSGNNNHALDQGFVGVLTDLGDNPDPNYPTLLASSGAVHTVSAGLFLGACVDTEIDGQPNAMATGDDGAVGSTTFGTCATAGDDEDGVTNFQNLIAGNGTAGVDVIASSACLLDAWVDFNQNGSFGDAGEQIFTSQPLAAGVNALNFAIPVTASADNTYSRFRCSSAGGLAPTGAAADGEVEDYVVNIGTLSLGDFVWYDTDQDGIQDSGEPGVNGITVNLYNNATCTGAADDTTMTANGGTPAADGFYQFTGLASQMYCVEFAGLPAGYQFTTQDVPGDDTIDSDANTGTGQVQNINLTADDPTIDAGVFLNGSIAGLTWCESATNANTAYDPGDGDTVLPNIQITLYEDTDCSDAVNGAEAGTAVTMDTANPAGTYLFSNLPVGPVGNAICYITEVDTADADLGNCDTEITSITLGPDLDTANPNSTDNNFGFEQNLSLGDFVWYDTDQNGLQGVGEPGVNGITVNLYDNATCTGASVDTTTTVNGGLPAADGFYQFTGLATQSYCIEFTGLPAGYQFTTQDVPGDDTIDSDADTGTGQVQNINLTADDPTIDAGIFLNGSVAGVTWCESSINANTSFDPGDGDTVLPNIGITLYVDADCSDTVNGSEASSAITQDTNNPAGTYLFSNLPVGPVGGALCYITEVNATDTDLGACDTVLTPETLGPDLDTANPDSTDNNFGFDDQLGLGDYVWFDTNQDGIQDAGEPGVNGITVNLHDNFSCTGVPVDTMVTANGGTPARDGHYFFLGLDTGDYCVQFTGLPTGFQFTAQNVGDDNLDSDADTITGQVQNISLTAVDPTIDAGVFANGSIAGLTWCESSANSNATYDLVDGDAVLTDIQITLYEDVDCSDTVNGAEAASAVVMDTANPAGTYLFDNLPVGLVGNPVCYVVEVNDSDADLGVCDSGITTTSLGTDLDTVDPDSVDNNFGFDDNLSLGDYVWFDTNQDGIQDADEPGVNGITVNLHDNSTCSGVAVDSTITSTGGAPATNGYYNFSSLDPGDYCVQFTDLPTGLQFTAQNVGDDTLDSDADTTTGQVQNISLTAVDPTIDAGVFANGSIAGLTWCESSTNSNTTYDLADGDTVLSDIEITLYEDVDCSDTVNGAEAASAVVMDTANPAGTYLFDNLPVGLVGNPVCYVVEVDDSDADLGVCDSGVTSTSQGPDLDTDTPDVTDVDFGFDDLLSLGDYIWYDNNQDGQQDPNEPGVNGIAVNLYDNASCSGVPVDTTSTATGGSPATDGYYNFPSLDSGDYCVEFSGLPVDYVYTIQNQGSDTTDSDADPVTGQVQNVSLTDVDPTIDVGVYANNGQVSGLLYCDDSPENGSQDAGEEISGVTITLSRDLDCDDVGDNVIGSIDTDGAGSFLFENLPVALAPAPPNPQACYVLNYDTSSAELSACNTPITPDTQVVTIDSDDPESETIIFGVAVGGPPAMVPVNSWWGLLLLCLIMMGFVWYHRKTIH